MIGLLTAPRASLADTLAKGHPVAPQELAGWRYRGISLGMPAWVDRLAWKTFEKDFVDDGGLRGWNVRLEQTGIDGPVRPLQKRGAPFTFGHFAIGEGEHAGGVTLDYGRGGNHPLDPVRFVRDPLVALERDDPTRLLGWTYLQLGVRIGTPSYFLLERIGPVENVARP